MEVPSTAACFLRAGRGEEETPGASLAGQGLRNCLLMQVTGSGPRSGKVPDATGQLRPCATTAEPASREDRTRRRQHSERPEMSGGPHLPQRAEHSQEDAAHSKIN